MKPKKLLLAASLMLCVSGQVMAQDEYRFEVPARDLFVPRSVATTSSLRYADGNFHLTLDGTERQVAHYNVKGLPSGLSEEKLEEVLKFGYFTTGGGEEEPTLQWKGRVVGGARPAIILSWLAGCDRKENLRNSIAAAGIGARLGGGWGALAGFILG